MGDNNITIPFGREAEVEFIQNGCIQPELNEAQNGRVFFLHGISGVGKTTLFQYTQQYLTSLQTHRIPICLSASGLDTDMTNIHRTIRHLYESLVKAEDSKGSKVGFLFPRYELACAYLCKEQNMTTGVYQIDDPSSAPWDTISEAADAIFGNSVDTAFREAVKAAFGEVAGAILGNISVSKLFGYACHMLISFIKAYHDKKLQQKTMEDMHRNLNNAVLTDIGEHLVDFFIQDFNESMDRINQPMYQDGSDYFQVYVSIDAFEKRPNKNTPQDLFLKSLIPSLHWTTWFLFSTEEPPKLNQQHVQIESIEIKTFNEDNIKKYLCSQGIQDAEVQAKIAEISQGLPAAIRILETIYFEDTDQFALNIGKTMITTYEQLFSYYLSKHIDHERRSALICMAVFRYWNYAIVKAVFGEYQSDIMFNWLKENTALVTKCIDQGDGYYQFVNVAYEALQSVIENSRLQNVALVMGNKGKYRYYHSGVDRDIMRIREHKGQRIPAEIYSRLIENSKLAFQGAINAYSDQNEFSEYSDWCLKTEQFLTEISFFDLKADLIFDYLQGIENRDHFLYDTEDPCFYFRMLRDQEWAYLNSGQWKKAIHTAKRYRDNTIDRYGEKHPHVPFAYYLCGLAYQHICDIGKAREYLEKSIELESEIMNTIAVENLHPDSTYPVEVIAENALGALEIDAGNYSEAERLLLKSMQARWDVGGDFSAGYENLSKSYFYWSWVKARSGDLVTARKHLTKAADYLSKIDNLDQSQIKKCSAEVRKTTLSLAGAFLKNEVPDWNNVYRQLERIKKELESIHQPRSIQPLMYCIDDNIAVLYALQGNLDEAIGRLASCIQNKNEYYGIFALVQEDDEDRQIQNYIQNKPTLRFPRENMEVAERYQGNEKPINPFNFILEY